MAHRPSGGVGGSDGRVAVALAMTIASAIAIPMARWCSGDASGDVVSVWWRWLGNGRNGRFGLWRWRRHFWRRSHVASGDGGDGPSVMGQIGLGSSPRSQAAVHIELTQCDNVLGWAAGLGMLGWCGMCWVGLCHFVLEYGTVWYGAAVIGK